eukprot:3538955-Alexandrium_andersonii.AAC.1
MTSADPKPTVSQGYSCSSIRGIGLPAVSCSFLHDLPRSAPGGLPPAPRIPPAGASSTHRRRQQG